MSFKRIFSFVLLISMLSSFVFVFCSCEKAQSADLLMNEFCRTYGISATVYTPSAKEGETGYVTEDFFFALYGEGMERVADFAIIITSDLDTVFECGVFRSYTDYDAVLVTEMLNRRLDLMRSVSASSGLRMPEAPFVLRKSKYVVMAALPDAKRAADIWKRIL